MKTLFVLLTLATLSGAAVAVPGQSAPAFTLADAQGKPTALTDYAGRTVVLEWVNFDCPFVHKHYGAGAMQALQKAATGKDVVWLSIASSAPGKQGWFEGKDLQKRLSKEQWSGSRYLVDADGKVGRSYGARTTPQMFVIAPDGKIAYAGAIDDRPSTDVEDLQGARNHVSEALASLASGKAVDPAATSPYGCSVKY